MNHTSRTGPSWVPALPRVRTTVKSPLPPLEVFRPIDPLAGSSASDWSDICRAVTT